MRWHPGGSAVDAPVSLGGETARAIALYRRCIALDPSARSFAERRIVALEAAGAR